MAIMFVSTPETLCTSGSPGVYVIRSTNNRYKEFDYLMDVMVCSDDQTTYDTIARLRLYLDESRQAEIDISKLLHDRIEVPLPDIENGQPHMMPTGILKYKACFYEYVDGELANQRETVVHYVVRSTIADIVPDFKKFVLEHYYLTNVPEVQETNEGGVHYLYFLSCAKNTYRLMCRAYSATGQTEELVLSPDFQTVQYGLYALPVGLFHKKISIAGGLTKYTVWLETVSIPRQVGRSFTFRLTDAVRTKKALIYENVYGGMDTVFYAERKEVLKVTREKRTIGRRQRNSLIDFENTLECSSGFITKKGMEMYKHLLTSERCYVVDNGFRPAVIEGDTFTVMDEREDLIEIGFTMTTEKSGMLLRRYENKISIREDVPLRSVLDNDIAGSSGSDVYVNREMKL